MELVPAKIVSSAVMLEEASVIASSCVASASMVADFG